jgi:hypothetical protein
LTENAEGLRVPDRVTQDEHPVGERGDVAPSPQMPERNGNLKTLCVHAYGWLPDGTRILVDEAGLTQSLPQLPPCLGRQRLESCNIGQVGADLALALHA